MRRPKESGWQGERVDEGVRLAGEKTSHNLVLCSRSPRRTAGEDRRF